MHRFGALYPAGRYEYYSEPKDVYRRHDNCGCSVTYENGRQRQDVWSKRTWEAPEPGAGAGEPVVFTAEQAEKLQAEHGLTIMPEGAIIETERGMRFRNFKSASAYMEKKFGVSVSSLDELRYEKMKMYFPNALRIYEDMLKEVVS